MTMTMPFSGYWRPAILEEFALFAGLLEVFWRGGVSPRKFRYLTCICQTEPNILKEIS